MLRTLKGKLEEARESPEKLQESDFVAAVIREVREPARRDITPTRTLDVYDPILRMLWCSARYQPYIQARCSNSGQPSPGVVHFWLFVAPGSIVAPCSQCRVSDNWVLSLSHD